MASPILTGVLSYGMSGRVFHTPLIDAHPKFTLYAITERTKKQACEKYTKVKNYDTVDDLINDTSIELVVVNTPNNTHYQYAKQALNAGKHVLVDKPFATSAKEAEELFEIGRAVNRKVMVFQNRRWDSDFLSVRKVIKSEVLGKINEVHFRFDRYRNKIGPKKFKETPVPGSGIAYDLGSHLLDQAISLFGVPEKSFKTTARNREYSQVDDYAFFHLIYPNQLQVFITANMLVPSPQPAFILHGDKGSYIKERADVQEAQLTEGKSPLASDYGVEERGKEGRLTLVTNKTYRESTTVPAEKGCYYDFFEAVYKSIRLNEDFPIQEQEVMAQMTILEMIDI